MSAPTVSTSPASGITRTLYGFKHMIKSHIARLLLAMLVVGVVIRLQLPKIPKTPVLFTQKEFDAGTLIDAANYFISRGETTAVSDLSRIASTSLGRDDLDTNERIGWICRILWRNDTTHIRPPRFGGLSINVLSDGDWPFYPLIRQGDAYFVLSEGYHQCWVPETPVEYIAFCQNNGSFLKSRIGRPTKKEALAELDAFRNSARWKTVSSYSPNQNIMSFLSRQCESIGK